MADTPWWKQKVIYQIYPMSFCDSNGDGIGDLPGIISRLDYLQKLGVGALWLSPVYPSPNKDNGYDISDYCNIHPNYGTLQDMDTLIAEAKKRDIRIIMDLVINHTSDQHEWFQKSRRRIEPYTDYYIWRKGEKGKKPTNWGNFFGGDCWEYDDLRGEYYLHLFAKEQPDLNYHNEAVIEAIEEAMHFWLERGAMSSISSTRKPSKTVSGVLPSPAASIISPPPAAIGCCTVSMKMCSPSMMPLR